MSNDVLYPLLIGGGCLIAVYLVHLLTRPKPTRADITLPSNSTEQAASPTGDVTQADASSLAQWHRDHETTLLNYFEFHDNLGTSTGLLGGDDALALSAAFEHAYATHPAPDMRAELAATRAAAEAMAIAKERDDNSAISRHHDVYVAYRAAWLERLWQFPNDPGRIARLRQNDLLA